MNASCFPTLFQLVAPPRNLCWTHHQQTPIKHSNCTTTKWQSCAVQRAPAPPPAQKRNMKPRKYCSFQVGILLNEKRNNHTWVYFPPAKFLKSPNARYSPLSAACSSLRSSSSTSSSSSFAIGIIIGPPTMLEGGIFGISVGM